MSCEARTGPASPTGSYRFSVLRGPGALRKGAIKSGAFPTRVAAGIEAVTEDGDLGDRRCASRLPWSQDCRAGAFGPSASHRRQAA
jgi:hypothetical protein